MRPAWSRSTTALARNGGSRSRSNVESTASSPAAGSAAASSSPPRRRRADSSSRRNASWTNGHRGARSRQPSDRLLPTAPWRDSSAPRLSSDMGS